MTPSGLLSKVRDYYSARLATHGPTPRGVDWNSAESQQIRFAALLRLCDKEGSFRLGDYGCGYGALYDYLCQNGWSCQYRGFDIAPAMVAAARASHANEQAAHFSDMEAVLAGADFIVASGIFNVKLQTPRTKWEAYVLETVQRMAALARRGFAFNVLTSYSDAERMRDDLYYGDPCFLFDYCKRHISRHVALLHDYGLYEFTIHVRHEAMR